MNHLNSSEIDPQNVGELWIKTCNLQKGFLSLVTILQFGVYLTSSLLEKSTSNTELGQLKCKLQMIIQTERFGEPRCKHCETAMLLEKI